MTPLAEAALAFARACLGWEDARAVSPDPDAPAPALVVLSRSAPTNTLFSATDPADAQAVAGRWCDGLGLAATLTPDPGRRSATAAVRAAGTGDLLAEVTAPHPSEALFLACVAARQRLRDHPA